MDICHGHTMYLRHLPLKYCGIINIHHGDMAFFYIYNAINMVSWTFAMVTPCL